MTREEIKNKMESYIHEKKGVTFIELERIMTDAGFNWEGQMGFGVLEKNLIYWQGWNQDAIDLFNELTQEKAVETDTTAPLTYMIDGRVLTIPQATRYQKYKKPHWVPIILNPKKGGKK